jgi:hypothetical protein
MPPHGHQRSGTNGLAHDSSRYATIIPVLFIAPANPGHAAKIPADTPHEAITTPKRNYATNAEEFQAYTTLQ